LSPGSPSNRVRKKRNLSAARIVTEIEMNRWLVVAFAGTLLLSGLTGIACSRDRRPPAPPPEAARTESAAEHPSILLPEGRAFLFTTGEAGADRLVIWDLDRQRVHAEVELGEPWHRPSVTLAGATLLLTYPDRLDVSSPVGTPLRTIWRSSDGVYMTRTALSRDGALVAVGTTEVRDSKRRSHLLVLRVADGSLAATFGSELEELLGAPPAPLGWREDGKTIDLVTFRQGGRHGAFGWVTLDGRRGLHDAWLWGLDPTGRYLVLGEPPEPSCLSEFFVADQGFRLIDTRSGEEVWRLWLQNQLAAVLAVSPRAEVLVARFLSPLGRPRTCPGTEEATYAVWDGTEWKPVDDLLALEAGWREWPEVRLECPGGFVWPEFQRCPETDGPDQLFIEGAYAGEYEVVIPIGVVDQRRPGIR